MNIFIDCGTHLGEGLEKFIQMYSMTKGGWQIYSFEPNKDSYRQVIKKHFPVAKINFIKKAVWIKDGTLNFTSEKPPHSRRHDGAGSTVISLNDWNPPGGPENPGLGTFNRSYRVSCLHLSRFIKDHFSLQDRIILKMDIEGAEFAVLEDLVKTRAIEYVDDLYVEFHEWAMNSKSAESKRALKSKLTGGFLGRLRSKLPGFPKKRKDLKLYEWQ